MGEDGVRGAVSTYATTVEIAVRFVGIIRTTIRRVVRAVVIVVAAA